MGRMAFTLTVSIVAVDLLGRIADGTALAQRFAAIIDASDEREQIARLWLHTALALRSSHVYADPWSGLQHAERMQSIYDQIGGEVFLLTIQLYRSAW
jgi:hypothetical protein